MPPAKVTRKATRKATTKQRGARRAVKKRGVRRVTKKAAPQKVGTSAAMHAGRNHVRIIGTYLTQLANRRPQGKPPSQAMLEALRQRMEITPVGVARIRAAQKVADYERRLSALETQNTYADAEAAFIEIAREWGERNGITYSTWRGQGIPASTLKKAGIAVTHLP